MFLGIDLGGTKCMFGLESSDKKRTFQRYPTGINFTNTKFIEILKHFISISKCNILLLKSVVLSICGLVDDNGIIGICEIPKLTGVNIKTILQNELNININLISTVNDAYAALHAAISIYPHETNMSVIICGTGIGSAFLIDGNILDCNNEIAGWIGGCPIAINIDNNNKQLKAQTLDDICGGKAIIKSLNNYNISVIDVLNNVINNERDKEIVKNILTQAGYYMGIGVCIALNMMKPHRIVFGGGVFNFPYFYDSMIKSIKDNMIIKEIISKCKMDIYDKYNELVCIGTLIVAKQNSNKQNKIKQKQKSSCNQVLLIIDELLFKLRKN